MLTAMATSPATVTAIAIQNVASSSIAAKYRCSATRQQSAIIVAPTRDASSRAEAHEAERAHARRLAVQITVEPEQDAPTKVATLSRTGPPTIENSFPVFASR
jgi:hypothetical protein